MLDPTADPSLHRAIDSSGFAHRRTGPRTHAPFPYTAGRGRVTGVVRHSRRRPCIEPAERGEIDRAIALWERRLQADDRDRKALDSLADLLASAGRWSDLALLLRRRIAANFSPAEQRADLLRLAQLQNEKLGEPLQAIATLQEVLQSWVDDPVATDGLLDLFAQVERWPDFLASGSHAADKTAESLIALLVRLGDVCRNKLHDAPSAITWYRRALAVQPENQAARDGLTGLLADAASRPAAVEALTRAYQIADDWEGLLGLLPHRLDLAPDDRTRFRLLTEAARLAENKANRAEEALAHLCAALRLSPDDGHVENEILRLAGDLATWPLVTETLAAAAASLPQSSNRAVHLRLLQATVVGGGAGGTLVGPDANGVFDYTYPSSIPAEATGTWSLGAEARQNVPLTDTITAVEAAPNPVVNFLVDGSSSGLQIGRASCRERV